MYELTAVFKDYAISPATLPSERSWFGLQNFIELFTVGRDGMNEVGEGLGIPTPPYFFIPSGPDSFDEYPRKITF